MNTSRGSNHYINQSEQEFNQISHVSHNSDCCASCDYIPPPHVTNPDQQRTLSRNHSHHSTNRTLIRDPVTNRAISVHSRSDYESAEGCSCINPSACLCLLTAALLILIGSLSSHAGVFSNLFSSPSTLLSSSSLTSSATERVFKGQFLITKGEPYDPRFEFPDSNAFKETSKRWSERLDKLFNGSTINGRSSTPSMLTKLYKRSEVLALERGPKGAGSDDVLLHFNLHFKRIKPSTNVDTSRDTKDGNSDGDPLNSASVYVVIATELLRLKSNSNHNRNSNNNNNNNEAIFGKGVAVDQSSLDVEERRSNTGNNPLIVNGGHMSNGNWIRTGSTFPFFSGRADANSDSAGRSSVGIGPPSWLEPRTRFPGLLEGLNDHSGHPGPRTCSPISLALCQPSKDDADKDFGITNGAYRTHIVSSGVTYNHTSWPNLVGHWNMSSLLDSVLMFRSLIDAECHPRAKEFICRLLQPECLDRDKELLDKNGDAKLSSTDSDIIEDIAVYPCRDFCTEFWSGCGLFITEFIADVKIRDKMKCSNYPRFDKDPEDDNFQYIDEVNDGKHVNNNNGRSKNDKSKDKRVTRKRKEGRRCRNR